LELKILNKRNKIAKAGERESKNEKEKKDKKMEEIKRKEYSKKKGEKIISRNFMTKIYDNK